MIFPYLASEAKFDFSAVFLRFRAGEPKLKISQARKLAILFVCQSELTVFFAELSGELAAELSEVFLFRNLEKKIIPPVSYSQGALMSGTNLRGQTEIFLSAAPYSLPPNTKKRFRNVFEEAPTRRQTQVLSGPLHRNRRQCTSDPRLHRNTFQDATSGARPPLQRTPYLPL